MMTNQPRNGPEERDEEVTRVLREIYAPPVDVRFWDELERRVLTRLEDEDAYAWWQPFGGWIRAGLIAAGITAVAAGVAIQRERDAAGRDAYRAVVETPRTLAQQLATRTVEMPVREATFQYVIDP